MFWPLVKIVSAFKNNSVDEGFFKVRTDKQVENPEPSVTRLITMRSKPDYFEVAFLLLLFFCLALLIYLSLDICHSDIFPGIKISATQD